MSGITLRKEVLAAKERYLSAPLVVDTEYIRLYTEAHRETTSFAHPIERRAECHARALERLTPCILPGEIIVGRKTKYVRGAVAYCNYASQFILRELGKVQEDEQDSVHEVGIGGGIEKGKKLVSEKPGEFVTFGKKFLLRKDEVDKLHECAEYWTGKCMQDVGDDLWKREYAQADYILNGWKAVLYTAAHDTAPEGRCVLDFETALNRGLLALAEEAEHSAKTAEVSDARSADRVHFWRAAARVLRATITFCEHYADEAQRCAERATDPAEREMMLAAAARLRHSPAHPPRDFAEAVQAYWMVYLAGNMEGAYMGYSPGRFDQYMYPFFEPDWRSGKLTRAAAVDMLAHLRVKMTELEYVASFAWEGLGSGNLFQNMILGGLTESGAPADNELSLLVVDAAIACRTTQPTLSVWYDERLSNKFLMRCAECVKTGVGFPAWFNLKCYIQHELECTGLPISVIRKYAAMGGCTEPTLAGMSQGVVQGGFVNLCKVFELAMYGGRDPRTGLSFKETPVPQTLDELLAAFKVQLREAIRNLQRYWNFVMSAHRQTVSLVFNAALTRNCLRDGVSLDDGGAVQNGTPTTLSSGMVNVVNCFAAVSELVNQEHECTLEELRKASLADWKGYERLRSLCQAAPKWGNDDDRADQWFVKLFDYYCTTVREQLNYLGKPYDPSMLAISTHAPFGRACLATPDGRACGDTLADGVTSPYPGTDVSGPFSVLLSAQKIDHTRIRGGLHNMKLHPSSLRGASGSRKLLSLIGSYFKCSSSFQIQFNVVDGATLRAAQAHPDEYRDLIVRVAGFSAYFVELAKGIQDEVIARTEHTLGDPASAPEPADKKKCVDEECEDDDDAQGALAATEGNVFDVQDFTLQDGPGVRTTVFLKGCPLRCRWCCNPEGQSFDVEEQAAGAKPVEDAAAEQAQQGKPTVGRARHTTAGEIVAQLEQRAHFYGDDGGVTLSGGEPLAQPQFAGAIVRLLARRGIRVAVETSGAWRWDDVRPVVERLSLAYFDIKAATPSVLKEAANGNAAMIATNLAHVVRTLGAQHVIVSIPVIPGVNANEQEAREIAKLISAAGARRVRMLPYHALGSSKYKALGKEYPMGDVATPDQETLKHLRDVIAAEGLEVNLN